MTVFGEKRASLRLLFDSGLGCVRFFCQAVRGFSIFPALRTRF